MTDRESVRPAASADFATTSWTLVLQTAGDDAVAQTALERLCRDYWTPLYVYVRCRGYPHHEAEDLTQGFFLDLLRRDVIPRADPQRGRFRAFLLTALQNHLHHRHEHRAAQKRGGGKNLVAFDETVAAEILAVVDREALSPDRAYDRSWTLALLDRAMQRLRGEQEKLGKAEWFDSVRRFLQQPAAPGEYDAVAAKFGMNRNSVAVAVHRLGARYRELVRAEVAETVTGPAELEDEVNHLLGSLAS